MTAPLSTAAPVPGRPRRPGRTRRALLRSGLVGALLTILLGSWLVWDNQRVVTTELTVADADLPAALAGFRIVQVSDLHSRTLGPGGSRLVDAVRRARPDAIALTGDLVDRTSPSSQVAWDAAADLAEIAPVYYVTGNHEAEYPRTQELLDGLEERGVHVLRGQAVAIERDGAGIVIAGIDDPRVELSGEEWELGESERIVEDRLAALRPEIRRAAAEVVVDGTAAGSDAPAPGPRGQEAPSDAGDMPFTVLLAHRPEMLEQYAAADVDVVLAGHAHGGQVRVPLIGPLFAPGQGWLPDLTSGVHRSGGTALVISRGLGSVVAPIRVNNPPEIVALTLER